MPSPDCAKVLMYRTLAATKLFAVPWKLSDCNQALEGIKLW